MKRLTIALAASLALSATSAQTLNKEIIIDRTINPTVRAANPLSSATPVVIAPDMNTPRLNFSQIAIPAATPSLIDTLPAADPKTALPLSPYRGYASLGYFPAYNAGISAGYRAIDTHKSTLGIWTQFCGSSYKHLPETPTSIDPEMRFNRNTATIGADFTSIISRAGRLDVSADFTYDRMRSPLSPETDPAHHSVTLFNGDIHWSARSTTMAYYLTADYHNFAFHTPVVTPATQHHYNFAAGTAHFLSPSTQLAGSISANFLSTSNYILTSIDEPYKQSFVESRTIGLINFDPSLRYNVNNFHLKLGLRLQFMSHMEKTLNVAPDISLSYTPLSCITAFASATGSKRLNSLASLWEINPYISPLHGYGASNVPLDARIGATFGPFHGASATIEGGYAMANDWLTFNATDLNGSVTPSQLLATNVRAFMAKATLRYSLPPYVSVKASYMISQGDNEKKMWYLNRDGAKNVLSIEASTDVIDRLDIHAAYELRTGRRSYQFNATADPSASAATTAIIPLKAWHSLNIGADYRVTEAVSAFINFENILCCRTPLIAPIPSQSIHGAVGVAIKF